MHEIKIFKKMMNSLFYIGERINHFEFYISHVKNLDNEDLTHAVKFSWWGGYCLGSTKSIPGISIGHVCWRKNGRIVCKDVWFYNVDGELTLDIGQYWDRMFEPDEIGGREGFLKCNLDSRALFMNVKMEMVNLI